jgi:hypothetical protein
MLCGHCKIELELNELLPSCYNCGKQLCRKRCPESNECELLRIKIRCDAGICEGYEEHTIDCIFYYLK